MIIIVNESICAIYITYMTSRLNKMSQNHLYLLLLTSQAFPIVRMCVQCVSAMYFTYFKSIKAHEYMSKQMFVQVQYEYN